MMPLCRNSRILAFPATFRQGELISLFAAKKVKKAITNAVMAFLIKTGYFL